MINRVLIFTEMSEMFQQRPSDCSCSKEAVVVVVQSSLAYGCKQTAWMGETEWNKKHLKCIKSDGWMRDSAGDDDGWDEGSSEAWTT